MGYRQQMWSKGIVPHFQPPYRFRIPRRAHFENTLLQLYLSPSGPRRRNAKSFSSDQRSVSWKEKISDICKIRTMSMGPRSWEESGDWGKPLLTYCTIWTGWAVT